MNNTNKFRTLTTCPRERIRRPLVCIKSVRVRPSTGESSNEPKSATCIHNYDENKITRVVLTKSPVNRQPNKILYLPILGVQRLCNIFEISQSNHA